MGGQKSWRNSRDEWRAKPICVLVMLVGSGNAERFHFAVKVGALEPDGGGRLRHIPAIFLKLAQNKFPLVGAAGFVQGAVGLLGAFDDTTK